MLGQDDVRLRNIAGTYQDTFILTAEVIEVQEKPSLPKERLVGMLLGRYPFFGI